MLKALGTALALAMIAMAQPVAAAIIFDGDVTTTPCPPGGLSPGVCYDLNTGSMTTTPDHVLVDRTWANRGDKAGFYFRYHHSGLTDANETFYVGVIYNGQVFERLVTSIAGDPYWHQEQVDFDARGMGTHPIQMFIRSDSALSPIVGPIMEVYQAVPEPSTWAMMLSGFLAMGLAIRAMRRRPGSMRLTAGLRQPTLHQPTSAAL